jgi:uncharacterized protein YjiS (DUF1127 family)
MSIGHMAARHRAAALRATRLTPLASAAPVLAWLVACIERARQRRALSLLDDHLLRDIGLTRDDVADEIAKPFWLD